MHVVFSAVVFYLAFALALPPFGGKPIEPQKILVKLYKPHRGQRKIHSSKARFRVVACGRRFGKTLLAANELARFALEHSNSECGWIAPWFRQSKIVYRLMRKVLRETIAYKSDAELRLEFKNGSVLQFFSAENPDAIRGNGFHFVVIDEAGDALRDEKVWFDAIRPTLSDKNGRALIIGTPKGRNLFYRMFTWGQDPEYTEWASFTAPTAANPLIPAAEIEAARRELPEDSFQQEYLALFLEFGAGVFKGLDAIIRGTLDDGYKRVEGHYYVLGWDPAKFQDYSVMTLLDCNTMRLVGWRRINQIDYTKQVAEVSGIARAFGAHTIMDSTGVGAPLYELLRAESYKGGFSCEDYLFTNATKKTLIENLQVGIQNQSLEIPDIPVLVNEMRIFEYVMTKARQLSYSAPAGAHDDAVISLALAYLAASQPRGPVAWSVDDEAPERSNERPEQPEAREYEIMQIESYDWDEEGIMIDMEAN